MMKVRIVSPELSIYGSDCELSRLVGQKCDEKWARKGASTCADSGVGRHSSLTTSATFAQQTEPPPAPTTPPAIRAARFLAGRSVSKSASVTSATPQADSVSTPAEAIAAARQQHAAMLNAQAMQQQAAEQSGVAPRTIRPRVSPLNTAWQPVGPAAISTPAYGNVSGRVTSIAIDPADSTGNTIYVGTTGGGVWKSTNAAGPATSVTFTPLTDTLPVFSANAGSTATASLSIGALTLQNGILLAGTGDPNDASDSYYGSGILRSTDGGLTWTLAQGSLDGVAGNHSFVGLGFAGFAWSTATPSLVVAAISQAAEGTLVNAPDATNSVMGLYYSTDSGLTWQMSVIMDGSQIVQTPLPTGGNQGGNAATAVVWNPIRQRFYAAIRYHGYYQSAEGVNWTRLSSQPGPGLTTTACPTNPGSTGSTTCPIFRGALAVQPITGDTFALTVNASNLDQGLWQDICASSGTGCSSSIAFSHRLGGTALEVGSGNTAINQADYNLALAAVSATTSGVPDTLLYVGTIDVYKCSVAAGCVLRNTTDAVDGCAAPAHVAPAQHALAALATSGQPLLYIGNDGGLWRSSDGINQQSAVCSAGDATHFSNLNANLGSLAEVVSFGQHPTDPGTILAGLGANGTAAIASTTPSSSPWSQLAPGEGGTVAIDPTNPQLWYISTGAGVSIKACPNGPSCKPTDFAGTPTIGASQVSGDQSLIDAPWLLDPLVPADILVGTCRIWRGPASSGALWSSANAISKMIGGTSGTACGPTNASIRSLTAAGPLSNATSAQNAGAQVLYAGLAGTLDGGGTLGGHLFSTTAANTATSATAWTDLATSPVSNDAASAGKFNPGGFDISGLAADPHDATGKTIYATVMGFAGNGTNAPHLYRSIDGGAHWTNISSNLPNAPANSTVVDPNDANTLYVALDTGVYVTTQVATCSSTNCWSIYGAGLPNAPVIQLTAAAAMSTGDGRSGELRAATYGRGIWQIPLLTAATAAQPAISIAPSSLTFASQSAGTISPPQTVTVTNYGNAPLTITQITATGDFTSTDNCTGTPIAAGSSCTAQVSFLPSVAGARTGVLTVYGNAPGGQATASLSGTATAAATIVLNPVTINFSSTLVGATSTAQNITISNTGNATSAITAISATGDFLITANTCGNSLAASTGCTAAITFKPSASGTRSGTLTVVDDAGTQTTALTGTGNSPATDALSPLTLTFAAQQLDTASTAQQITLTNNGDVALTLIAAQITSGDFTAVNACGNSLNPHSSCSIAVSFAPKSIGPGVGTLTVSDQFRSQTVSLNGTGIAPPGVSLSPISSLAFPATPVGTTAAAQTVTLTNNGGLPLNIAAVTLTGDFGLIAVGSTCGNTLAIASSCTMQVSFAPTAAGPRNGTLTVTDNALNSPQTITLTGTGVDFTLAPNGSTTVTVANGSSAVYPLLLSSAANVPGTATLTCAGVPANAKCTISPASAPSAAPPPYP